MLKKSFRLGSNNDIKKVRMKRMLEQKKKK